MIEKHYFDLCQKIYCSSQGVLWCIVFYYLSHFEFIFVCGVRESFNLIHWHVAVQVFKHHYLKDYLFFTVCSYFLSQRLITVGVWVYYWALWPVLGRLRAGVEGSDRRWDGWMASLTQWTWVWINSGEMVRDREAWHAAVHGVTESQTWHSTDQQQLTCAFDPYKCFVLVPWSFDYCNLVVLSEFWAAFFFLHRIALVILGLL